MPSLAVPSELPLDAAPPHTREMWLTEALALADVVVRARGDGGVWQVDEVLCGDVATGPLEMRSRPGSELAASVIRILALGPRGYFEVSPSGGVTDAEWAGLSAAAGPRDVPEGLRAESTEAQRMHMYTPADGEDVWHGLDFWDGGSEAILQLHVHGERVLLLAFQDDGIWQVSRRSADLRGFEIAWRRGRLQSFSHYIGESQEGLARAFNSQGQIRSESRFQDDRRHGVQRHYDDAGVLENETTYEDGLILPIVHPRTGPTEAEVFYGHDGDVSYSAPDNVVRRITVGMAAQDVADLLGLPLSETMGLRFPHACRPGTWVEFAHGSVSGLRRTEPEAHCQPLF